MQFKVQGFSYNSNTSPATSRWLWCLGVIPAALVVFSSAALASPSATTGKAISGQCAACHGSDGVAVNSQYPNLAGQHYPYLVQQLEAFKSGKRKSPIMHAMASGLSKKQIKDLADYYASLNNISCSKGKH